MVVHQIQYTQEKEKTEMVYKALFMHIVIICIIKLKPKFSQTMQYV